MVGKKGTLRAARSLLYRHGVRALRTTELAQVGGPLARVCSRQSARVLQPNTGVPRLCPGMGCAAIMLAAGEKEGRRPTLGTLCADGPRPATVSAAFPDRGAPVGARACCCAC